MSQPHPGSVAATNVPDIVWMVSLWLAIHGGDPAPEEQEVSDEQFRAAVDSMANALRLDASPRTTTQTDQLKKIGMTVHKQANVVGVERPLWCFSIPGTNLRICARSPT